MKTIGYAIVGTGYFGAELGRIMKEQEGARIVAVLDPENCLLYTSIAFYKGSASGRYLLNPGDFMVCYPSDAHMVAIMENKPENIEKVVVKIKVQ